MASKPLFQSSIILKRREVANIADIIKIIARFLKNSSKTQEKLGEREIMYQNPIFICISCYNKIC